MLFTVRAWHLSTLFILSVVKHIPSPLFHCFALEEFDKLSQDFRIMDAELLFALALKADTEKA